MKTINDIIMETVNTKQEPEAIIEASDKGFVSKELEAVIAAAKEAKEENVKCKFGSSKFINVSIEDLEKIAKIIGE